MTETSSQVWPKFLRNKTAVFSLSFIVISFFISLIAYLIIPDNSPNANAQYPTIALKSPGFKATFIGIPKTKEEIKNSFLGTLIHGKKSDRDFYVCQSIEFQYTGIEITNFYNRKQFIDYDNFFLEQDSTTKEAKEKNIKEEFIQQKRFLLGTDKFGRDIFSRLILGIRISIFVGLLAVFVSLIVGIFMGAIAGYFGGFIDQFIMLIINISWSIPTLLMVFAIVLAFDRGVFVIFIAVGLTMWVEVARIVRGQVQSIKEEQYIVAAKSMGFKTPKIIVQHILPNIIGPILVVAAANFSTAVLVEAGLSYLGFGVEPPTPSIGNMLNEHYGYALTGKVFLAINAFLCKKLIT